MRCALCLFVMTLCVAVRSADEKPAAPGAIGASVATTLATASPQIRMFAFDGDEKSYYASSGNPTANDHFTLVFDKAVELKSVSVATGRVNGDDKLDAGELQFSADGKTFEKAAEFAEGNAKADGKGAKVMAVRIKPTAEMTHPLAVKEFTVVSEPAVTTFKYPVEVFVNCTDAPELKEWTENTARVCEKAYQMICEELKSDNFTPKTIVNMVMTPKYKGVAATSGFGRSGAALIQGSPDYFSKHKSDVGAMVHEMVHVAQNYRGRTPGWVTEGIADFIRNYKYEPEKPMRKIDPDKVKYDGLYQISARFLMFLTEKYDKDIVKKINRAAREGKYSEDLIKELTTKTLPELDAEWKEALKKPAKV